MKPTITKDYWERALKALTTAKKLSMEDPDALKHTFKVVQRLLNYG